MRFSIRELLCVAVLAALGMLAYRNHQEAEQAQVKLTLLQNEIQALEASLRQDNPALHQAILRSMDESKSLQDARQRAIDHFALIRQKYSGIEPRGADVLSLSGVPMLPPGNGPAPISFRMRVPEQRAIWLKYGVHPTKRNTQSGRGPEQESDLLTQSPFEDSGPFEMSLPPGDQILVVTMGAAEDGSLPLAITLDDQLLLRSTFVAPEVTGAGWSSISGRQQIDFDLNRALPSLMTVNMSLRSDKTADTATKQCGFSMWLSDHSSDFAEFPRR
jgi:hypothetical protein